MKNLNKITIGVAILSTLPFFAFAQTPVTSSVNGNSTTTKTYATRKDPASKDVAYYIQKGDAAVAQRVTSLNKRIAQLDNSKHLTAAQIAIIKAPITDAITAMNAAKAKLDADTDLATAKADYNSIFKDNRIYMVIVPQERTIKSTDLDAYHLTNTNTRVADLQSRIDAAKAAGKDVTASQAALDDAKAKLADVSTNITTELSEAAKLAVDHGDKTIVAANKAADANVKAARKAITADFKAVTVDFKAVVAGLPATNGGAKSN